MQENFFNRVKLDEYKVVFNSLDSLGNRYIVLKMVDYMQKLLTLLIILCISREISCQTERKNADSAEPPLIYVSTFFIHLKIFKRILFG